MPKTLRVGFDDETYGTVTARDGVFAFAGPKPDAVRHLAEASATAIMHAHPDDEGMMTAEAVMSRMADTLQGRAWAVWADG